MNFDLRSGRRQLAQRTLVPAKIAQWSPAILLVIAFYAALALIGAPSTDEKETLRNQFHLPPEVSFSELRVDRKSRLASPMAIEGVVRFSEAQFRDYARRLNDPGLWRPLPIKYDGVAFQGPYSPDALKWEDLPGKRRIGWGSLSWKQAQEARNGKLLCFAVRQVGGDEATASFRGETCSDVSMTKARMVLVQGLIDADNKTLHMIVRGIRPPTRREF